MPRHPLPAPVRQALRHPLVGRSFGAVNQPTLLARAYGGTDKVEHGYLPFYRTHLGPHRRRARTVLEIGVGGYDADGAGYRNPTPGGSLKVWRDYFPRATIIGLDIEDKRVELGDRVRFVRADQGSASEMARVADEYGPFDVVIDDGSHIGEHQWVSFEGLWPHLTPGGWYVVEDLATSYHPAFEGAQEPPARSGLGLVQRLVDAGQAGDITFGWEWWSAPHSGTGPADVRSVHCYPGVAFVQKA